MWGKKYEGQDQIVKALDALRTEVRDLGAKIEVEDPQAPRKLTAQVERLKAEIADLGINRDREREARDREKRETEHRVGLMREKIEQDRQAAVREAELRVREQHLKAKEDLFEERIEAVTDSLKEQVSYLRTDIIQALMSRLPTVTVDRRISEGGVIEGDRP